MLKLMRGNMVWQSVAIVAVMLLLWWHAIVEPGSMTCGPETGIIYRWLAAVLAGLPHLAVVIAMLLVLAEGLCLNLLMASAGLVPQTTLLPTMLYLVAMSACNDTLSPVVLLGGILVAMLRFLLPKGNHNFLSTSDICSVTALIGIGTMLYLPAVGFLLSYLLIATNYRLYNWRDWAAMLLGLLEPYLVLVIGLYLTGNIEQWWQTTLADIAAIRPQINLGDPLSTTANIVLAAIAATSILAMWVRLGEHTVVWQHNASTIMLFAIGGLAAVLAVRLLPIDTSALAIPFALCGTHMLVKERTPSLVTRSRHKHRAWIPETILLLIIIAAVIC